MMAYAEVIPNVLMLHWYMQRLCLMFYVMLVYAEVMPSVLSVSGLRNYN